MILCQNPYPAILDDIFAEFSNFHLELVFVRSDEMQQINKNTRNIDKTTDVLSFPLEIQSGFENALLGSIVINLDLVSLKATEFGHSDNDEIALLFIHGLLHILGFDHETDSGQMRQKECEMINKFNLPKSLIVRTTE